MSERNFRFILGITLWAVLIFSAYYENMVPIYVFVAFLLFEGITNLRVTTTINRLRHIQAPDIQQANDCNLKLINKIEAERALRIIVAAFVILSFAVLPDLLWFIPWFVAGMLILAGITNICPMVMFLKWAGLK